MIAIICRQLGERNVCRRDGAVLESSWPRGDHHLSVRLKSIVIATIFACAYDFAFEPLYFPVGGHTR
jgi:hypothetical protein